MELCNYPIPDKTRYYEIEAIQIPIVYNKYGDHDPDGLLYVLKKDATRIQENALYHFHQDSPQPYKEVVPLVIRANVGETVIVSFSHSLNRPLSIHVQGLFGAIIVEAAESRWLDPETGEELESGLFADIYHPARPSFREYAVFFHDELEIKDKKRKPAYRFSYEASIFYHGYQLSLRADAEPPSSYT